MTELDMPRNELVFKYNLPAQPNLPRSKRGTKESRLTHLGGGKRQPNLQDRVRPTPPFLGEFRPRIQPGGQETPSKTGRNPIR